MANKYIFYNNYRSTLADALLIAGTTANVVDAGDLVTPAAGETLLLTLTDPADDTAVEIIKVTAVASLALTIERAQEGTTAREWAGGTIISARLTAAMLNNMAQGVGLDIGGNAKGSGSLELQSGRSADTQVASGANAVTAGRNNTASGARSIAAGFGSAASGQESIAVGDGAVASGTGSVAIGDVATASAVGAVAIGDNAGAGGINTVAIGDGAIVADPQAETAWAANTLYGAGATVKIAGSDGHVLKCRVGGTSGSTEPSVGVFDYSKILNDGTVIWEAILTDSTSNSSAACGDQAKAMGYASVSLGASASAIGAAAVAIGASADAAGNGSVAINGSAKGRDGVSIKGYAIADDGRSTDFMVMVGGKKYAAFNHAGSFGGLEFIDQHDWWYVDNDGDEKETAIQTTRKMTFYSIPIQLGDAGHPGTSQTVAHGYSIVSGGYIYTAYCYNGDYFDEGTTAGSTPSLTTTPGDSTADGTVDWICVMPAGGTLEKLLPDYARFTPTAVGAVARSCTPGGSATYPQLTFGINGSLASWLAATTFSKLTGDFSNHMVAPTATVGAKQFGVDIDTAGTDLDCVAVIVWEGYVVESQTA